MSPRVALASTAVITVLLSGCGDQSGAATTASELDVSCGAVTFDSVPAEWSDLPLVTDLDATVDLSAVEAEREFFDLHTWHVADESGSRLLLFGVPDPSVAEPETGNPFYADATFRREGDHWIPDSWGQCRIEVSTDDWGNAAFVLDPDVEPEAASSTISVLAWERACASGQAPEGRGVEAVVMDAGEQTVSVVVLVEPVHGDVECPGNPSFPLEIDLGDPLGDRTVLDASVDPPFERPWPPTQTSLDSQGAEQ